MAAVAQREIEISEGVAAPEEVLANFLESATASKAMAEAYRKIFKASSFDLEAKKQICESIDLLIGKWRRVKSTIEHGGNNAA
jgi:hypothetical protein